MMHPEFVYSRPETELERLSRLRSELIRSRPADQPLSDDEMRELVRLTDAIAVELIPKHIRDALEAWDRDRSR